MRKLFQNKVTIILLIIALVVLLVGAPVYITRDGGESWEQIEMPDEKAEVKKIEVTDELITRLPKHLFCKTTPSRTGKNSARCVFISVSLHIQPAPQHGSLCTPPS